MLLIEALPRLGGRARTETINGVPLDFGCAWLHSAERNPLTALAEENGQVVDRRESAWHRQMLNRIYGAEDQGRAWAAYEQFLERLHSDMPKSDRAADALASGDRWRPFIDALSSFINGTELDGLSVADVLAYEDASSDANWRIKDGYGAFIAGMGAGVPVAFETTVKSISHGNDIELETNRGRIQAGAAIVTVSTAVLASGAIGFVPAIDEHLHAASRLPLGVADKVFLSIADPNSIPAESHLIGRLDRAETGSYYIRPFGRPVIECYLGGAWARRLEEAGEGAAVSFVTGELRDLLGADFVRRLAPLAVTHWVQEASIGGSYSHALPGHANARNVLARPVSERLCFAGEACSAKDFSTAHGAWESGVAAADWIESYL